VSTDYGTSWTDVDANLPNADVWAITALGSDVFAGTFGSGVLWQRPLSEMVTSINEPVPNNPFTFIVRQNYPNPFNPKTIISYSIPEQSNVTIIIYDALGREVANLVNEEKQPGSYEVEFESAVGNQQLASGIYFYQLRAGEFIQTKKMVLLR
ncbi:MAG: hypothetical protein COT22_09900, partial [Ignavibacteria bacterium CG08_land_8_20_14_0_20_37_9]